MLRNFTGGQLNESFGDWELLKYVHVQPDGADVCGFDDNGAPIRCAYLTRQPVHTTTFNWAAFLQDSWSILPNLTLNAGLRYEQQRISYADGFRGTPDPVAGGTFDALSLTGLFAPRVGLIYDWTKEGRSKVFANWGRFYESVPMDINVRSFGGEELYFNFWDWGSQCGGPSQDPRDPRLPSLPGGCPRSPAVMAPAYGDYLLGGNSARYGIPSGINLVTPGLKPQYMDEFVVGAEYEVLADLRLGVSYQNRRLGRVIEDTSPDGGRTYIISNPSEFDAGEEQKLLAAIQSMPEGPTRKALISRLQLFRDTRRFDQPSRVYQALQITATKRFSRAFYMQGSYTYSSLRGNYPGLLSPDNGQLDPNISSQYDLFELLANRYGPLPADRPHSVKLDGYYTFDLGKAGSVTTGARFSALSGSPIGVLGRHALYGPKEAFVLPRGSGGRTAFQTQADLHVAYGRKIGGIEAQVYVDLLNVFNNQVETAVDEEYTTDAVHPVTGGDANDLRYARAISGAPLTRKLNYGNTTVRSAPLTGRIGLMLTF